LQLQEGRSYESLEEIAVGLLRQHPKKMLCEADLKKQIVSRYDDGTLPSRIEFLEVGPLSKPV
jgi:hypothetical protein